MVNRLLRHFLAAPLLLRKRFPPALLAEIEAAVRDSELRHSGEIRFAIQPSLPLFSVLKGVTAREAATRAFSELGVWDTEDNSGVLIYVLLAEHDLEIVADRGIVARVAQTEWNAIAQGMERHFRSGNFRQGALEGIYKVSELLAAHFPARERNPNELSDKPVILR